MNYRQLKIKCCYSCKHSFEDYDWELWCEGNENYYPEKDGLVDFLGKCDLYEEEE